MSETMHWIAQLRAENSELEKQNERIRRQWLDEVNELLAQRDEWRQKYERQCVGTHSRFERIRNLENEIAGWKRQLDQARKVAREHYRVAKQWHTRQWGDANADIAYRKTEAEHPLLRGEQ
jgi:predicted RNase H-like nuclease (RuvC/YqgF family)